jgi:hypothetical protein
MPTLTNTARRATYAAAALVVVAALQIGTAQAQKTQPDRFVLKGKGFVVETKLSVPSRVTVGQETLNGELVRLGVHGAAYRCPLVVAGSVLTGGMAGVGEMLVPPLFPLGARSLGEGSLPLGQACGLPGAEHVYLGTVRPGLGYTFESAPEYPLTFFVKRSAGYVYLCGRGVVTPPRGAPTALGTADTVDTWLPQLASKDWLRATGAAEALGYLAQTPAQLEQVLPALLKALKHPVMQVRRNAAESLGRLGDARAADALSQAATDKSDWVRAVAAEALGKIRGIQ